MAGLNSTLGMLPEAFYNLRLLRFSRVGLDQADWRLWRDCPLRPSGRPLTKRSVSLGHDRQSWSLRRDLAAETRAYAFVNTVAGARRYATEGRWWKSIRSGAARSTTLAP